MKASQTRQNGHFLAFFYSIPRIWTILSFIFLSLTIGMFWYWSSQNPINLDNILPGKPILVWKGKLPTEVREASESMNTWIFEGLSTPSLKSMASLEQILSLSNLNEDLWTDQVFTMALYQVSSRKLEVLGLMQCNQQKQKQWRKIIDEIAQKLGPAYRKRRIMDITLEEIQVGTRNYSLFFYQDFILGSFSPFLLEDVIRRIKGDKIAAAPQSFSTEGLPKSLSGNSEVFVDHQALLEIVPLVLDEDIKDFLVPFLAWASQSKFYEIPSPKGSALEGWGLGPAAGTVPLFSSIHLQEPSPFEAAHWIPQNTSSLLNLSYRDGNSYFPSLWQRGAVNPFQRKQVRWQEEYGFSWDSFWGNLKGGLYLCFLESSRKLIQDKVLILPTHAGKNQILRLNQLSRKLLKEKNLSPSALTVAGKVVSRLPVEEFPASFMGEIAQGFPETYYTLADSCLIIVNNLRAMQNYLNHLRDKRVWKYSRNHKALLQAMGQPAQWRLVLDASKSWGDIQPYLQANWEDPLNQLSYFFMDKYVLIQGQKEKGMVRSHLSYYPKGPKTKSRSIPPGPSLQWTINLGERLYTGPTLMKNHLHDQKEILVQDFQNQLYLLDDQGKLLWKKDAGAPMRSRPLQIDIYHNDKLQYLFITPDRISLVDRLGRYVPKFPFYSPDSTYFQTLAYLNAWGEKKHYFLTSDKKGNVYMYDEQRNKIPGWRPLRLRAPLASAVQSLQIENQLHFLIVQENGLIRLFSQDARPLAGFPLDTKEPLSNPLWLQEGIDLSSSKAVCLSDGGSLIEFNLIGEELGRIQLPRLSEYSTFSLCPSQDESEWIVARHDGAEVSLFDSKGQMIFEKTLPGISSKVLVQYFILQNGRTIFCVTDKIGSRSYLYDRKGNPVSPPLRSNQALSLEQNPQTNQVSLYVAYARQVDKYVLALP